MGYKLFAWQGLEFEVPEDWELGQEKGDYANGFIRLDDLAFARLGVNWQTLKEKNVKSPAEFVRDLKKRLKKKDKQMRFLSENKTKVCSHPARYFRWKSAGEGYDLFWYCDETRRAFVAEFAFKPEEYAQMRPVLDRLIETARCHGREDFTNWAFYGLSLQIPAGFQLVERAIYTTGIHLFFSSKTASFMLDRIAFGQSVISEKYHGLKEWFEKVYRRQLRKTYKGIRSPRYRMTEFLGHDALAATSPYRRGMLMRRYTVESKVWLCEASNRLFAVSTSLAGRDGKANKDLKRILSSVRCHEQALEETVSDAAVPEEA
ncbi:MAG: hypothetical protein QW057_05965 [Candidatus Bathyarchaeia archaeon]